MKGVNNRDYESPEILGSWDENYTTRSKDHIREQNCPVDAETFPIQVRADSLFQQDFSKHSEKGPIAICISRFMLVQNPEI